MRTRLYALLIILAWVFSACGGNITADPNSSLNPATQTASNQPSQDEDSPREPGCTVVGSQPAPVPTEQSIIPTPKADEWAKGPEDAYVTIIEYSDFQ